MTLLVIIFFCPDYSDLFVGLVLFYGTSNCFHNKQDMDSHNTEIKNIAVQSI